MILCCLHLDNKIITGFIKSSFNNFLVPRQQLYRPRFLHSQRVREIEFCDCCHHSHHSPHCLTWSIIPPDGIVPSWSSRYSHLLAPTYWCNTVYNCEGRLRRFYFFMNGINFQSGSLSSVLSQMCTDGCWSSYSIWSRGCQSSQPASVTQRKSYTNPPPLPPPLVWAIHPQHWQSTGVESNNSKQFYTCWGWGKL